MAKKIRKFTLRDSGGVLKEIERLTKDTHPKPSLNTYIIEAIKEKNLTNIHPKTIIK
jgi:hypothetical protein